MRDLTKAERLQTAREVAETLNVSISWVLAHANGKRLPRIPSVKLGRSVRFRQSDIEAFVERCRRAIEAGVPIQ